MGKCFKHKSISKIPPALGLHPQLSYGHTRPTGVFQQSERNYLSEGRINLTECRRNSLYLIREVVDSVIFVSLEVIS